ncbi:C-type mannose receptor 2 [Anolis carolinensis]|uniref:C-type mannose receptor 2 n=1 Tax=Anolis carolinensis TaxID=28377 RepID=UPI002F2B4AB3
MGCRMSFSFHLFGFFLVSLLLQEVESCDRGWLSYRGFCYGFFQERKTWAEAEVDCISMGGHLASIHSSEESDRVAKYIASYSQSNKNVWIGMHVPTGTNEWAWVDRTKINYVAWKTGAPYNFSIFGDEECIQLVSELEFLRWNDADKMRPISYPWLCYLGLLIVSLCFRRGTCYRDIYQSDCNGDLWSVLFHLLQVRCLQYNQGHLASILNEEEKEIISNLIASKNEDSDYVWIGLHDPQQNRRWRWVDQSITTFQAWDVNEPDNWGGNESCVQLNGNTGFKYWNDANCYLELPYVCKYDL